MKKLRLTRLLAVILAVIMVLPLFVACKKDKYDNEKDQLVVALEEPDGVFNSFSPRRATIPQLPVRSPRE